MVSKVESQAKEAQKVQRRNKARAEAKRREEEAKTVVGPEKADKILKEIQQKVAESNFGIEGKGLVHFPGGPEESKAIPVANKKTTIEKRTIYRAKPPRDVKVRKMGRPTLHKRNSAAAHSVGLRSTETTPAGTNLMLVAGMHLSAQATHELGQENDSTGARGGGARGLRLPRVRGIKPRSQRRSGRTLKSTGLTQIGLELTGMRLGLPQSTPPASANYDPIL